MKRAIPASVLCMTMALCCVGCGSIHISFKGDSAGTSTARATGEETGKLVLTVTDSSWSGWNGGSVSKPKGQTFEVKQGEHYVVSEGSLGLAFTITEVGNDSITIETDEKMSPRNPNGTINLGHPRQQFTVTLGDKCEFATPTMDGGTNYTLSLSRE